MRGSFLTVVRTPAGFTFSLKFVPDPDAPDGTIGNGYIETHIKAPCDASDADIQREINNFITAADAGYRKLGGSGLSVADATQIPIVTIMD